MSLEGKTVWRHKIVLEYFLFSFQASLNSLEIYVAGITKCLRNKLQIMEEQEVLK